MNSFIGRNKELDLLEGYYRSKKTEFLPIYGRRRVGKSELIVHFIKNKPALYFLGKKALAHFQIKEFLEEAARCFGQPLLKRTDITNWKEALSLVVNQKKNQEKLIIVLDEFQWTAEASPELPSILQGFLDREWKNRKDIFLIVCGSYIGFMEKEVLGEKSPLFGRRSGQIFLKPFSFRETSLFHKSWSIQDKAKAYFICGGIPLYLLFFNERNSVAKNIEKNFLDINSALFKEPEFLLREELRELPKYYALLMCLSRGLAASKNIAMQTGIDERKMYYYINNLIELGYVERIYPLTSKEPANRDVRFVLKDQMLKFWFRFIYPHTAYISRVDSADSFKNLIEPNLDSYFGSCFEHLCREALSFLYQRERISSPFEIGQYWDKRVQIDVVGYRTGEGIDIGECKWGKITSTKKLIQDLQEKIKNYPNKEGLTIRGKIFSRYALNVSELPKNIELYTLESMYK